MNAEMTFDWVTVKKAAEMSGYTPDALKQKRGTGALVQGVHWKHGTDGKVLINVKAFNNFLNKQ